MDTKSKPPPPKRPNPMARVVTHIKQQIIPNKKKQQPKNKPDHTLDWAFFMSCCSTRALLSY